MERPDEKYRNSADLRMTDRSLRGFLASLEEKKKEAEWMENNLKTE